MISPVKSSSAARSSSDELRQPPEARRIRDETAHHEELAEPGPLGRHPDVGHQRELHAPADGRAVHGRDDRDVGVQQRVGRRGQARRGRELFRRTLGAGHDQFHVVAGTERGIFPGDHEAAHLGRPESAHDLLATRGSSGGAGRSGPPVGRASGRPRGRSLEPQVFVTDGCSRATLICSWKHCSWKAVTRLPAWLGAPGPGLSVEVGGRLVVESADFTVCPATRSVSSAATARARRPCSRSSPARPSQPAGRRAVRRRSATCPGSPHAGVLDGRTAVAHVLSGRGLDAERERIEKLRIAMEERPTSATSPATPTPRSAFRLDGGYAAEREVRRSPPASGSPPTGSTAAIDALSGGERRRVELARILFAGSDVLLPRRADQPPRHRRQGMAHGVPALVPRRAARDQPRPRAARRGDHPRAAPRATRAGSSSSTRAPTRSTSPRGRRTRSGWPSSRRARPRDRPAAGTRRSLRGQGHEGGEGATPSTSASPASRPTGSRRREATRSLRGAAPGSAARRPHGRHRDGLAKALRRTAGVRGRHVRRRARRAAARARPQRRGQDDPAAHPRRRDRGRRSATFRLGHNVSVGYYAQEHEGIRAGTDGARPRPREVPPTCGSPRPSCAACSACSGFSGDIAFQDAGTLSGGEKTKLALAHARRRTAQPAAARRADEQPRPAVAHAVGRALRGWPGAMVLVSHDTEFVDQLAPDRCCSCPTATLDYWCDDFLDLVALA